MLYSDHAFGLASFLIDPLLAGALAGGGAAEDRIAALQGVSHWAYAYGRLALFYADGQGGMGRLLFVPQAAPDAGEGQ